MFLNPTLVSVDLWSCARTRLGALVARARMACLTPLLCEREDGGSLIWRSSPLLAKGIEGPIQNSENVQTHY